MRDFTSVTKPHEPGVLSTYAMKVAFFKELDQFPDDVQWAWEDSPSRVKNILNIVQKDGLAGSMTGYFIKDDPVLMESDRGYLEVRRMTKDMHVQMDTDYFHSLGVGLYNLVFVFSFILMPLCVGQFCNSADSTELEISNLVSDNSTVTGYDTDTNSTVFKTAFHGLLALLFSVGIAIIKRPESQNVGPVQRRAHGRHFLVVMAMALGPVITYNMATALSPKYSLLSVFLILAVYNGIFISLPHKKYWYRSDDVAWLKWIGGQPHGIREVAPWNDLYAFYWKYVDKETSPRFPWATLNVWMAGHRRGPGTLHGFRWARFKHWLTVNNKHFLTFACLVMAWFLLLDSECTLKVILWWSDSLFSICKPPVFLHQLA